MDNEQVLKERKSDNGNEQDMELDMVQGEVPDGDDAQGEFSDEDDGRTIADMSGIDGVSLFGGRRRKRDKQKRDDGFEPTKKEQLLIVLGTLKAALLIGLVYIVGLGAVIGLLFLLWKIK